MTKWPIYNEETRQKKSVCMDVMYAYIDLKWQSASILLCTDALARAQLTQFAEGELQQGWPLSGGHDITHPSSRTVVFSVTSSALLTAQQSSKCDAMK